MLLTVARWLVLAATLMALSACDVADYIEGCGSVSDALLADDLAKTDGAHVDLGGVQIPLPVAYFYRVRDGALQLFPSPGVYCDSGDWGLIQDGFLQLQVHREMIDDPFENYPQSHRGYMREQIDLGLGSLTYALDQNQLSWKIDAYFSYAFKPTG